MFIHKVFRLKVTNRIMPLPLGRRIPQMLALYSAFSTCTQGIGNRTLASGVGVDCARNAMYRGVFAVDGEGVNRLKQ